MELLDLPTEIHYYIRNYLQLEHVLCWRFTCQSFYTKPEPYEIMRLAKNNDTSSIVNLLVNIRIYFPDIFPRELLNRTMHDYPEIELVRRKAIIKFEELNMLRSYLDIMEPTKLHNCRGLYLAAQFIIQGIDSDAKQRREISKNHKGAAQLLKDINKIKSLNIVNQLERISSIANATFFKISNSNIRYYIKIIDYAKKVGNTDIVNLALQSIESEPITDRRMYDKYLVIVSDMPIEEKCKILKVAI